MLNWFDITVFITLAIALVSGYRKGLVMQLAGLAGIVIAILFGGRIAGQILPWLSKLFDLQPNIAAIISYALAFIVIIIAFSIVGKALHGLLEAIQLNFINRILGGLTAMGIAMVVLSLLLHIALSLDTNKSLFPGQIKTRSFFFSRVEAVLPAFVPYLNKDVWEQYLPEKQNEDSERDNPEEKYSYITI